jgi:hypothetical protein
MTGILPGTEYWNAIYPNLKQEPSQLHWRRILLSQKIAIERANAVRSTMNPREVAYMKGKAGQFSVSMNRPDISLASCIGASLEGYGIHYMDVVAIHPIKDVVSVSLNGDGEPTSDDGFLFKDFCIDIGEGITIEPGQFAELSFREETLAEALATCPSEKITDAKNIRKMRKIYAIKVSKSGEKILLVQTNRGHEEVITHSLNHITGRVFARYSRQQCEKHLLSTGAWEKLSWEATVPDLLKPEFCWGEVLSSYHNDDIQRFREAFYGECLDDSELVRKVKSDLFHWLYGHANSERIQNVESPTQDWAA